MYFIKKLIKVFIIFSVTSCGGSGDTVTHSGSSPTSIRDIENANNLAEKSRYGTAVYGKITYQ